MTQERHKKHPRIRAVFYRGWNQIALAAGMSPEVLRKTWFQRRLPIWHERGRPVTSKAALEAFAKEKVKEARRQYGW